jgi:hypothetical protein
VNYARIRDAIQDGDLLAWSHRGWRSWHDLQIQAVRFFTQSEYCHVGVAYRCGQRMMVYEAVGKGVRIFPLSKLLPFYHLPLGLAWNAAAEQFVWDNYDADYSKLQAIQAHLGRLHAAIDNRWQCAELAQALLKALGLDLACKPTPTELVLAAQKAAGAPLWLVNEGL